MSPSSVSTNTSFSKIEIFLFLSKVIFLVMTRLYKEFDQNLELQTKIEFNLLLGVHFKYSSKSEY